MFFFEKNHPVITPQFLRTKRKPISLRQEERADKSVSFTDIPSLFGPEVKFTYRMFQMNCSNQPAIHHKIDCSVVLYVRLTGGGQYRKLRLKLKPSGETLFLASLTLTRFS